MVHSVSTLIYTLGHINRHNTNLSFVQANRRFTNVEEYEVLGLVRHKRAKIAAHNTMPSGSIFLVKVSLNMLGNILLFRVCLQGCSYHGHCIVLHNDKKK